MLYFKAMMLQYLVTVGWAVAAAVSMGIGLAIALKVFTLLTPKIDEVEELRKGNIAVAVVLAAVVLAMAIVVALTIMPESAAPQAAGPPAAGRVGPASRPAICPAMLPGGPCPCCGQRVMQPAPPQGPPAAGSAQPHPGAAR